MNEGESKNKCLGLCPGDSGVEEPIPCYEAKEKYGICIKHGRMKTNGELRFRMNCKDGSAYIRTQTSPGSEGWQNAHYHKFVQETYIVEKGWIGYIQIENGQIRQTKYTASQKFTTVPRVAHNIYMPPDAIIHTVKHGAQSETIDGKSDWFSDGPDCQQLTDFISQEERCVFSGTVDNNTRIEESLNPYTEAYRHFDNLIWQVPTWASGLFAATVAIVWSFLSSETDINFLKEYMSKENLASVMLFFFGMFTLVLAYTLYRFRWHQVHTKTWRSHCIFAPQSLLQLVVTSEAAILFFGCALLTRFHVVIMAVTLAFAMCVLTGIWEYRIRREATKPKRDLSYLQKSS